MVGLRVVDNVWRASWNYIYSQLSHFLEKDIGTFIQHVFKYQSGTQNTKIKKCNHCLKGTYSLVKETDA